MIFKPLKLKARNGEVFSIGTFSKNDNYIELSMNWYSFGMGGKYHIGDSRRFFDVDFLWFGFELWF